MFKRLFSGLNKSGPLPDLPALQNAAVRSIASEVTNLQDGEWEDREWVYLAVNHEVLVAEGRRSSTQAKVIAHRPGAELEELGVRLSMESKAHLLSLRDAMADVDGKTWTVVDLTVERSGTYDFAFGYDAPPRLSRFRPGHDTENDFARPQALHSHGRGDKVTPGRQNR